MPDPDTDDLLARAAVLPDGPLKVALHEEAVARADARRDTARAFELRRESIWVAVHGDRPDLVLAYYAWCLGHLDRHPAADPGTLVEDYGVAVSALVDFIQIPLAQILAAWDDLLARALSAGQSPRLAWLVRRSLLCRVGDRAGAAEAHRRHLRHPRHPTGLSEEEEAVYEVGYRGFRKDDRAALSLGERFLARRRLAEPTLAAPVLAWMLLPLARAGRVADALPLSRRLDRLTAAGARPLGRPYVAWTFHAVVGNLPAAVRQFNLLFADGLTEPGEFGHMGAYQHGLFLARELVRRGRRPSLKVPAGVPGVSGTRTPPGPLCDWLELALPDLSRRADERHGNGFYTAKLAELDALGRLAKRLG